MTDTPATPPRAPQRSLAERAAEAMGAGALGPAGTAPALGGAPGVVAPALPPAAAAASGAIAEAAPPPASRPAPPPPPAAAPPPSSPSRAPAITAKALEAAGAVAAIGTRSRASEEVAVIQNQVLRTARAGTSAGGRNPRLVLVSSALPGEGKTFTSLNLAAGIARMAASQPVLLVDADGKPGAVSELLGCGRLDGLRALALRPGDPVQPLVVPTEFERLSFLPYGQALAGMPPVPPAPAIAAALLRVAEAMPRHLIVIDTPPALSTSEATTLAPLVGQVLVVVRAEATQRNEVEAALDMMDACPTLQLVLNQARVSSSDSFGVYGYEAYGIYPKAS